ncbi:MAG: hypothetical protein IT285_02645 [Bdellovibrionales bacterium]|nr:hypothetical protein [Bdellovibrionales bacterium]
MRPLRNRNSTRLLAGNLGFALAGATALLGAALSASADWDGDRPVEQDWNRPGSPSMPAERARVAVVVLSYNGDAASHAGELFFEGMLGRMRRKYSELFVLRGAATSAQEIQAAMADALATGKIVDFLSNSHSNTTHLQYDGFRGTPSELLQPALWNADPDQLGLAANFGCLSAPQANEFHSLGFKSYIGHDNVSIGAQAMLEFLDHWMHCLPLYETVKRTNHALQSFYGQAPQKALWQLLASQASYETELVSSGENQQLCLGLVRGGLKKDALNPRFGPEW